VPSDSTETQHLLEQARQGDRTALADLLARHRECVRQAVALRLDRRLAARVDVSDVVQETFLEAARRLATPADLPDVPFALWLSWLARDRVLMLHRQHLFADRRAIGREVAPLPADSSACLVRAMLGREPSPSQALAAVETAEVLRQVLGTLGDDERDLILWRHFEQLSNRDIARLLNITEAAAGKRYIRALERLRGLLVQRGLSEPGA
jgi:RNA polymerase sigma-70 factor, ECF subfamily